MNNKIPPGGASGPRKEGGPVVPSPLSIPNAPKTPNSPDDSVVVKQEPKFSVVPTINPVSPHADRAMPHANLPQAAATEPQAGEPIKHQTNTENPKPVATPTNEVSIFTDNKPQTPRALVVAASEPPRRDEVKAEIPQPEELTRVEALGYELPRLTNIPSYTEVIENIDLPPVFAREAATNAPIILEVLRDANDIPPEDYISVATQTLREQNYPEEALTYATHVAFPSLMAMHADHQDKGFKGVVEHFVEYLTDEDAPVPHTLDTVREKIDKAITFVEHRPEIIEKVNNIFTNLMDAQREGIVTSNIVGVVETGSYVRGDASAFSDVDILLVSKGAVTPEDLDAFTTHVRNGIDQIDPSLPGIELWPLTDHSTFELENLRELADESDYQTQLPGHRYTIFATDPITRDRIEAQLTPILEHNTNILPANQWRLIPAGNDTVISFARAGTKIQERGGYYFLIAPNGEEREFFLPPHTTIGVGRVRTTTTDILLFQEGVSDQHAMLRATNDGILIIDNNSRGATGVAINEQRVQTPAKRNLLYLRRRLENIATAESTRLGNDAFVNFFVRKDTGEIIMLNDEQTPEELQHDTSVVSSSFRVRIDFSGQTPLTIISASIGELSEPAQDVVTATMNEWNDGQRMQIATDSQELTKIQQLGYSIPTGRIPSFEEFLDRLDPNLDYRLSEDFAAEALFNDRLFTDPHTGDKTFICVATSALQAAGLSQDALDYAAQVAFPSLMALHKQHTSKSYKDVTSLLIKKVLEAPTPYTRPMLEQDVAQAIAFVEHRPQITEAIKQIFTDWMSAKKDGTIQSNIDALVQIGSMVRGDATYLSDVDLLAFSRGEVTPEDYQQFRSYVENRLQQLRQIDPALEGLTLEFNLWPTEEGRPIFSLPNARAELDEALFSTIRSDYEQRIFAVDQNVAAQVETALADLE